MWNTDIKDLEELKSILIQAVEFNTEDGYSFNDVKLKMSFDQVKEILGEPDVLNEESDQQQTMEYNRLIDHPKEGKRDHHKLNILFWAFNREPFDIIKIHFDYYKQGEYATSFKEFVDELIRDIEDKLGEPSKKSLRNGKEEISYRRGKNKFS
ncbi:MAG: hypothetical protein HRT68_16980, partial [Flavobacteriaceae bacterium]|nr:hypothetical protein [Flavobacteriaceae bacterium]